MYKPSTHRIFLCLSSAPSWAEKLLETGKEYDTFLKQLLQNRFFEAREEKITVKWMANRFGLKPVTITKWLERMYDDVFQLNEGHPELFESKGIKHNLNFQYTHGTSASFAVWLDVTPRLYERVSCYFVKAKVGCDYFWVKEVQHSIEQDGQDITVYLEGGFVNKYREWLVDRAKFERVIGFVEEMHLEDFQIDDRILAHYRNNYS